MAMFSNHQESTLFKKPCLIITGVFLLAFLAGFTPKSIALSESLYEAMVPVSSQMPQKSQTELLQEGLKKVLLQVSGTEKILTSSLMKSVESSVDNFVTRFSYKEDADKKRFLRVKFDENKINEVLRRMNAPILSQERPETTVWIVVEREKDSPHFVSLESENELYQLLSEQAKLRAIPLIFPLLDLTDTQKVSEKTVWEDDFETLESVSNRYNKDMLWIGKLSKQPTGWHGQWTVIMHGKRQTWDNTNDTLDGLTKAAMDEFAKRLGKTLYVQETPEAAPFYMEDRYSISDPTFINPGVGAPTPPKKTNTKSRFRLSVSGVNGMEQYTKLKNYLTTLPGVQEVETSLVNPEETLFEVVSISNRETLIRAIDSGKVLLDNNKRLFATQALSKAEKLLMHPNTDPLLDKGDNEIGENKASENKTSDPLIAEDTLLESPLPSTENEGILHYKMAEAL